MAGEPLVIEGGVQVAGVRKARKQATRERVLQAARDLFDEIGFEASTIRLIAERAGVAVGSVFTTFASKSEVLSHVMLDRLDSLYAELDSVLPHLRGSCADRLRSIMAIHYGFEMRHPRLFSAFVASSFEWSKSPGIVAFGQNTQLKGMLRGVLEGGMAGGEVEDGADLDLFIDTLLSAYGFNYRLAADRGLDAAGLTAVMDRQIGLLFEGVRPRLS